MSIPRRNVAFNKPEEPAFLKAFKARVGYREPDTVETKRAPPPPQPPRDDGRESDEDREDEQPTVVVLGEVGVSPEEYQEFRRRRKEEKSTAEAKQTEGCTSPKDEGSSGKMVFRKPVKRRSSESGSGVLDATTSKKPKPEGQRTRKTSTSKGIKNNSLLSFGEDEDDDG